MTYPDWKRKVHEEFDKYASGIGILSRHEIVSFYEKAFDNLLVEVEGAVIPKESASNRDVDVGWDNCREETLANFTRFKGEDSKV